MTGSEEDLRVARTNRALKEAFEELVLEKDVDKITITELTKRAGVNRKTFYLHYETIEALYDELISALMDEFFSLYETTPDVPEDLGGHAKRFFTFLATHDEVTERLVYKPGSYDFGSRLYYDQMMKYKSVGNPFEWLGPEKESLVLVFIRSTALDFYRRWIKDGKKVPIEEAAELLATMTCYGANALMK